MSVLRRLWAFLQGYYWNPCPLCKREFSSEDKGTGYLMVHFGGGKVVCPRCVQDGTLARENKLLAEKPCCNLCVHMQAFEMSTMKTGWCNTSVSRQIEVDDWCPRFERRPNGEAFIHWRGM